MGTTTDQETNKRQGTRFGPSSFMILGGIFIHPLSFISILWGYFAYSVSFRTFLWKLPLEPWREWLLWLWDLSAEHPGIWTVPVILAATHLLIRFLTAHFSFTEDYLFVQIGLFSVGSPGGFFRIFNDPIAFSTVTDCNTQKGLLGLLTGTGTLLIKSTDMPDKVIRLSWVPNAADAQKMITDRAGVRKARMLSAI